ncbi:hypothetical protein BGZ81_000086 [Podila clonocystis]|nr:hypothetical protein BGZ81_000086 [Podila clonocystis]
MECAEQGDLQSALPILEWEERERIAGEIAHGLSYMHREGVIHCDIKTQNVLLTRRLEVRICDFGSARWITDSEPCVGTEVWMAPELLQDPTKYTPQSDVYALGLVMWAMAVVTEKPPTTATGRVINQYIRSPGKSDALDHVPLEYLRTMQGCCNHEPEHRPAASRLSFMKYGPYLTLPKSAMIQLAMEGDVKMQKKLVTGNVPAVDVTTKAKGQALLQRGINYFYGNGVPKDVPKAMELCRKAAAIGCEDDANAVLGQMYVILDDFKKGMQYAQRASHIRDGSYLLGLIYENGHGVEVNKGEAQRCFYMAALEFHSASEVRMAVYSRSQGNYERALKWIRKALEHEQPEATYILGHMYNSGEGVTRNYAKAESLFYEAAEHGVIAAIITLGLIHIKKKDFARAMELLLKVEDDPEAQNIIGHMHFSGMGVLPDADLARQMFQKSADRGNYHSQHALGRMHRVGFGAKVDFEMAIEYYGKAAKQGHLESEVEMAECLAMGRKAHFSSVFRALELGSAEAEAMKIFQGMDDVDDLSDSE